MLGQLKDQMPGINATKINSKLGNFSCFCCRPLTFFFIKIDFSKNSFRNTIKVSNDMVLTVCKGYQQTMTKVTGIKKRVDSL